MLFWFQAACPFFPKKGLHAHIVVITAVEIVSRHIALLNGRFRRHRLKKCLRRSKNLVRRRFRRQVFRRGLMPIRPTAFGIHAKLCLSRIFRLTDHRPRHIRRDTIPIGRLAFITVVFTEQYTCIPYPCRQLGSQRSSCAQRMGCTAPESNPVAVFICTLQCRRSFRQHIHVIASRRGEIIHIVGRNFLTGVINKSFARMAAGCA